jgi:hypothetical protein
MERKTSHHSTNLLKVFAVLTFLFALWTASSALAKPHESSNPKPQASQELTAINFEKDVFSPIVDYVEDHKITGQSLEYELVLDRATEDPEYLERLLERSSSTEKMKEASSVEAQVGKDLKKIWEELESKRPKTTDEKQPTGSKIRPGKLMLGGTSSGGGVN